MRTAQCPKRSSIIKKLRLLVCVHGKRGRTKGGGMQAEKGRTHNNGRKDAHTQIKGMYAWEEGSAFRKKGPHSRKRIAHRDRALPREICKCVILSRCIFIGFVVPAQFVTLFGVLALFVTLWRTCTVSQKGLVHKIVSQTGPVQQSQQK